MSNVEFSQIIAQIQLQDILRKFCENSMERNVNKSEKNCYESVKTDKIIYHKILLTKNHIFLTLYYLPQKRDSPLPSPCIILLIS